MNTLIILIKNPIAGKTKTRLAASVGDEKALKMYRQLMDYTQQQTAALPETKRDLLYSETVVKGDIWPESSFHKGVQSGEDLGERMANAFAQAFASGAKKVVIIGSDCPGITTHLLAEAFTELDTNDLVIGPATDGGYYLLGMRKFTPQLFSDIAWSTSEVAKQTLNIATANGLTVTQLVALSDVDYLEDWLAYGWEVPD